ncbi:MAG: hypothetical protein MJE63_17680 [Proteobacteria bacterium]|nr:hypothetical protein [Pseudomonadota bacterium]
MTIQTEALYSFMSKTIKEKPLEELNFLANDDKTRKLIQEIVDMPDRSVHSTPSSKNGKLSKKGRLVLIF